MSVMFVYIDFVFAKMVRLMIMHNTIFVFQMINFCETFLAQIFH